MALSFNNYGKRDAICQAVNNRFQSTTRFIRVYPDTVPFPSSTPTDTSALPAGEILTFTNTHFTLSRSGNAIIFTAGTLVANTTAAGTLSWFALFNATGTNQPGIISDAVSLSGGNGGILIVSTLTPGNGDPVTISLNLTAA